MLQIIIFRWEYSPYSPYNIYICYKYIYIYIYRYICYKYVYIYIYIYIICITTIKNQLSYPAGSLSCRCSWNLRHLSQVSIRRLPQQVRNLLGHCLSGWCHHAIKSLYAYAIYHNQIEAIYIYIYMYTYINIQHVHVTYIYTLKYIHTCISTFHLEGHPT